jgi:hypothetical protein
MSEDVDREETSRSMAGRRNAVVFPARKVSLKMNNLVALHTHPFQFLLVREDRCLTKQAAMYDH